MALDELNPFTSVVNEEKKFRINAKKYFLTYPQSGTLTKEEVEAFINTKGHAKAYIIAQEEHKGEGVHIHTAIWYADKVNTTNNRIFDINGRHPNIRKITKGWKRVISYLTKTSKKKAIEDLDPNPIKYNIDGLQEFDKDDYGTYKSAKDNYEAYQFWKFEETMQKRKEVTWPIKFYDGYKDGWHTITNNIKDKNRSIWIWGEPNWGKSLWWQDNFAEQKVWFASGNRENRWETYRGETLCIWDDVVPSWEEIRLGLSAVVLDGVRVPGKPRYKNIFFEKGSVRTFIVLNNNPIDYYFDLNRFPGIPARFNHVLVNAKNAYANDFLPDPSYVPNIRINSLV